MVEPLDLDLEARIEELGYELVEIERAGSRTRPLLRIRIDRADAGPRSTVDLEDCTRVSRALENYLEERGDIPTKYVLEVSSPGIERPLVKPRDYERFRGERVAVVGSSAVAGSSKRIEGELLGLTPDEGAIRIRPDGGEEVVIDREKVKRVHLVYRWGGEGRPR